MNLIRSGKLICQLRKEKGLTQKQLADKLGILPKTVSKWETGKGFPDVSVVCALADVLGVSEKVVLSGRLDKNGVDSGNMKKTKFYVCPHCGSVMHGVGNCRVVCCGQMVDALTAKSVDDHHEIKVTDIENDFYIEIDHEMTKEHYISFVAYVGVDRALTVRLYPEQCAAVRFPKMFGGKFYYYCTADGLFEYIKKRS